MSPRKAAADDDAQLELVVEDEPTSEHDAPAEAEVAVAAVELAVDVEADADDAEASGEIGRAHV